MLAALSVTASLACAHSPYPQARPPPLNATQFVNHITYTNFFGQLRHSKTIRLYRFALTCSRGPAKNPEIGLI